MPEQKDFHSISYSLHEKSYNKLDSSEQLNLYRNWFDNGTVDIWRHLRMLDFLDVFIRHYPNAAWLTVGDGRFGTSAIYIGKKGGKALPTDIDLTLLKVSKENNMIADYKYANAEALPFEDQSFDFSYCKESFHHFPRAYIGLYEMIRVSRIAVLLTEPRDWLPAPIPRRILQVIKHMLKRMLGQPIPHPDSGSYEEAGNYEFTISERELQKIALGLNLPCIAFKTFHDVYIEGVEYEKADERSLLLKKIKRKIFINTLMRRLGLIKTNHISAIIFKKEIPHSLREKLVHSGFRFIDLPKNPYVPA